MFQEVIELGFTQTRCNETTCLSPHGVLPGRLKSLDVCLWEGAIPVGHGDEVAQLDQVLICGVSPSGGAFETKNLPALDRPAHNVGGLHLLPQAGANLLERHV